MTLTFTFGLYMHVPILADPFESMMTLNTFTVTQTVIYLLSVIFFKLYHTCSKTVEGLTTRYF